MRAPTKDEEFNSRRRHVSLDDALLSDKRKLHATRPLYVCPVIIIAADVPRCTAAAAVTRVRPE